MSATDITTKAAPTATAAPAKARYKGKAGAQILHEMLVNDHKVDTMFGYPGGAILPMFDQLYKTPAKFILNRHEQASGHCADGYARVTGKPGVVTLKRRWRSSLPPTTSEAIVWCGRAGS